MCGWIKSIEVENRDKGVRSEKLKEHRCTEGYIMCLKEKRVEWNGGSNAGHVWEQV